MVNASALAAVKPRLRNIYFAADNRLDIYFLRLLVKINCAVHYAVVSNGNAVHAEFFGTRQQQIYLEAPSSRLYCVCTCRWVNFSVIKNLLLISCYAKDYMQ